MLTVWEAKQTTPSIDTQREMGCMHKLLDYLTAVEDRWFSAGRAR